MADFFEIDTPQLLFYGGSRPNNAYFILGSAFVGAGGNAPVVAVSPLDGTTIQRSTQLVVDITDADGATDIIGLCVSVRFKDTGAEEVVLRLGRLANTYSGSTISSITNGTRITITRAGGWPSTPTVQVDVVDAAGEAA